MHLKIPFFSKGLRISNSKPGCKVSAPHYFVKWIPPMAFWNRAHSEKCFFQPFIPELTPVSLLESGFEIVTQLATISSHLYMSRSRTTFLKAIHILAVPDLTNRPHKKIPRAHLKNQSILGQVLQFKACHKTDTKVKIHHSFENKKRGDREWNKRWR